MLDFRTRVCLKGIGYHRGAARVTMYDGTLPLAATLQVLQVLDLVGAWLQFSSFKTIARMVMPCYLDKGAIPGEGP